MTYLRILIQSKRSGRTITHSLEAVLDEMRQDFSRHGISIGPGETRVPGEQKPKCVCMRILCCVRIVHSGRHSLLQSTYTSLQLPCYACSLRSFVDSSMVCEVQVSTDWIMGVPRAHGGNSSEKLP